MEYFQISINSVFLLMVNIGLRPSIFFQAQKFNDEALREKIRKLSSPMDAAILGIDRENPLRDDWDYVKDDIMRIAVMEKFKQNDEARDILLATNDLVLVEHTKNDSYWGDGGDGSGKNMLGNILMETRNILRAKG
ncbi:NADAR family protein [Kosakonia cowanii]|uniref:NADAR family protein n=1 Tax=Kosakonia cowanii TaxID=208223 RepID=UPI00384D0781